VHDFAAAFRRSDGELVLRLLAHVSRLFVIFQSVNYSKATLFFLGLLLTWRSHDHPAWITFCQSTSSFDEEFGETSLGNLTQALAGDSTHGDISTVRKHYLLLPTMKLLFSQARDQVGMEDEDRYELVDLSTPEAKACEVFIRSFIQRNIKGDYLCYSGEPSKWTHAGFCHNLLKKVTSPSPLLVVGRSSWAVAEDFLQRFKIEVTRRGWVEPILEEVKNRQVYAAAPAAAPPISDFEEASPPPDAKADSDSDPLLDEGLHPLSF
jgi:hypothetical protein